MKQIIMIFLVLIFSSCSSSKSVQTEKVKEKITIDSTFNRTWQNKEIEIEWILANDSLAIPYLRGINDTANKGKQRFSQEKIPKSGKIRIRITRGSIKSEGKAKTTQKIITKTKKKKQNQELKPKKTKSRFNFLYGIIFAFCVKYLWNHRKIFKKIWSLIK